MSTSFMRNTGRCSARRLSRQAARQQQPELQGHALIAEKLCLKLQNSVQAAPRLYHLQRCRGGSLCAAPDVGKRAKRKQNSAATAGLRPDRMIKPLLFRNPVRAAAQCLIPPQTSARAAVKKWRDCRRKLKRSRCAQSVAPISRRMPVSAGDAGQNDSNDWRLR